jgi:uncharacterized protein with HEPN domain
MPRRDAAWLRDMLNAARAAHAVTIGETYDSFLADIKINNPVVLQLLFMGEAAKSVSETTCQKYPHVNWRRWKRTRDTLIHVYFNIDLQLVWEAATQDLPALIAQLEAIVETEYGPKN